MSAEPRYSCQPSAHWQPTGPASASRTEQVAMHGSSIGESRICPARARRLLVAGHQGEAGREIAAGFLAGDEQARLSVRPTCRGCLCSHSACRKQLPAPAGNGCCGRERIVDRDDDRAGFGKQRRDGAAAVQRARRQRRRHADAAPAARPARVDRRGRSAAGSQRFGPGSMVSRCGRRLIADDPVPQHGAIRLSLQCGMHVRRWLAFRK